MVNSYSFFPTHADAAVMNDYCNVPPFVAQSVPPLVLLENGRDHKLYYEAFNEAMDLDEDGRVDIGYMHNIDYYGYFDPYKCYSYNNATGLFSPVATSANKFCASGTGYWSGNVLNWLNMSRMDVLRKVLYGGHRSTDSTTSTILERVYIPGDAHSWGKEIPGQLCGSGSIYKNTCYNNSDCDTGYTCQDKSQNLIGMNAADHSVCPATAITWSTAGKILVAQFAQAGAATSGPTHADLLNSFYTDAGNNTVAPLSLIDMAASGNPGGTSSKVEYIDNFSDGAVNPENIQTDNTNLLAVTSFKTANDDNVTGIWQFAVDGDDGVEVEILPANRLPTNPANWIVANYFGDHPACFLPSATTSPNNKAFCNTSQSSQNNGFFNSTLTGKVCSRKSSGNWVTCTADSDCSGGRKCVGGGISLQKNTSYFMIVRQTNGTGNGGVRVWYRKPLDASTAWSIFGSNADLTLSSPTIAPGNECGIRFKSFVDLANTTTGENRQHLFCGTTRSVGGAPVMRLLKNRIERKWNWASKERPVCADVMRNVDDTADITLSVDTAKTDVAKIWDYTVRVEVCKNTTPDNRPADKQDASASGKETNCRPYKSGGTTTYKPAGLLQKYGEGSGAKVCSRAYYKTCTSDANCTNNASAVPPVFDGLCIEQAPLYFGLMTDSYVKNLNGGVLRKDIWSLSDEINMATGQFIVPATSSAADFNTTFPQGGIIPTFEALRTVGFKYDSNSYEDTSAGNNGGSCGWIVNNPLGEGSCRMWGNPIGEMMYEGLRYLAGKSDPTASFIDASAQDGSLPIYRQDWGVVRGSNKFRPYGDKDKAYPIFPSCSKPFMLVISDENVSYDSDSLPGSQFSSFAEDAGLPKLNINVGTLTDKIGGPAASGGEGIQGMTVFVGETTTLKDFMCTPKTVTQFSKIRGLCSEEPTKQGSYYSAAVAYYGKTLFNANTGKPNVTTYSLTLSSPVPKMTIPVNGTNVTLVPVGKSTSGGGVENSCSSKCTLTINAKGSLVISGCSAAATSSTAGSFCPSNQIVDFYVDTILYDNNNAPPYTASNLAPNITYAKFRINFEDVEQGADHDMDAISTYEICTGATCSPAIASGKIKVSVTSDYAAGGINQAMGFVISGTTEDGTYLVVRDSDSSTTCTSNPGACDLPLDWDYTFNVSSSGSSATLLHSPLWYAAKWGGFNNINGNNSNGDSVPDLQQEWDKTGSGVPDNYYLVVNPLKLEQQLDKALTDILAKTSSGTAASIVNNRGQSGSNILTAIFYPQKDFGNNQILNWLGDLQNYWYYFDPYLSNSTIREDTVADDNLILTDDYKVDIHFDASQNKTVAARSSDDGKGTYTTQATKEIDDLNALWRAGMQLYSRDLTTDTRTIYTQTDDLTLSNFTTSSASTLQPYLGVADVAAATKTIKYTLGYDTPSDATLRNRSINFKGVTKSATTGVGVWKLGDIINSTPKIQSGKPLNGYHLDYGDSSYAVFIKSGDYVHNTMVYAGANDGMLHAFRLGQTTPLPSPHGTEIAELTNPGTSPPTLGSEVWAFIPKNALPYLQYLSDPNYGHLYYVDNTPLLVDASINKPGSCSSADYWDCPKITTTSAGSLNLGGTSWRTVVVGSMGLGGASRKADGSCVAITGTLPDTLANCVKTPLATSGYTDLGLSSYFALDVTNANNPSLLWEFSDPDLGYSTVDPVIVRINGKKGSGPNPNDPDPTKNGRWFLVFGSGPTGPLEPVSHQFYARSDKNLKIFVVDLNAKPPFVLNTNYWVFEPSTPIANAFCGSLTTNGINVDKKAQNSTKYYDTEVVYIGYVKPDTTATPKTWTDGGILRLVTNGDTDPVNWSLSTLIDGVGPVTASIDKMYDDKDTTSGTVVPVSALWLYFGTGRFYYKNSTAGIDSATNTMHLYGIKEPCYSVNNVGGVWSKDLSRHINTACTADTSYSKLTKSTLTDQSSDTPNATMLTGKKNGWFIDLDASTTTYAAERLITTPDARTNGMVVFTTFKPTADICGFGGETFFWFTDFKTGGPPRLGSLTGKIVIQLSTGAIIVIDLSKIIGGGGGGGGGGGTGGVSDTLYRGGRQLDVGAGKPPTPKPAADSLKTPVKKLLQIQEK